jgi:hypothetical protein
MATSVLANRYIGTGVRLPADRTFELLLCREAQRLVLVSWEGYLTCLEVRQLPTSIEQVVRLGSTDHLAAALAPAPGSALLVATNAGKLVHRLSDGLETASSFKTRGQSLYSTQRREQGTRVVGAAAVGEGDWAAALHGDGQLSLHAVSDLTATGVIPTESELLAFTALSGSSA